jgi:hypothetical protein
LRDEVVVGRSATIGLQLYDDETRVESSTPVTVEVVRADGTEVVPAATATTASGVGLYQAAMTPAQLDEVDVLTATWAFTLDGVAQTRRTVVEVIGAHYFELAELRSLPGLGDPGRFPTAKLAEKRTEAQDEIERELGVALVERFASVTRSTAGCRRLRLRHFARRLLSGAMGGTAFTPEQVEAMSIDEDGNLEWSAGWFVGDVVLRFAHGYSTSPAPELRDIALELARMRVLGWRSSLPDQTVDADDLGQQTPAGEAADRNLNQGRLVEALQSWRRRQIGPVIA